MFASAEKCTGACDKAHDKRCLNMIRRLRHRRRRRRRHATQSVFNFERGIAFIVYYYLIQK